MNFRLYLKSIIAFLLIVFFANSLKSEDTITVQTLTFEDITNRRGVWQFPDGSESFRKILAYYTLKCDRQTAQDIFDCGEWDYGANIFVYQHTGVMDSNLVTHPKYNFGGGNPDTLKLCFEQPYSYYQKKRSFTMIDEVISENDYILGDGSFVLASGANHRFQILYTKDILQENDMLSKQFDRLKIKSLSPGITLKNMVIRHIATSKKELDEFVNMSFEPLYQGDYTFSDDEWTYIDLDRPLSVTPFQGIILDISFEEIENASEIRLYGDEAENSLYSDGIGGWKNGYLEFDGVYDRVDCGIVESIKNEEKITVEMKLKIHQWRQHGNIFRIGNGLEFKTVEEYNQPRRYFIRMQDGDEYGIMVGGSVKISDDWNHFAIVFDGTKDQYDGRIKFYLNGYELPGYIRGKFPDKFPDADNFLRLNWTGGNLRCDMDEFRIWSDALPQSTLESWIDKTVNNEHEYYDKLEVYYPMNSVTKDHISNMAGLDNDGFLIGTPQFRKIPAEDQMIDQKPLGYRPMIGFLEGEYEKHTEEEIITEKEPGKKLSLIFYEIGDHNVIIKDNIIGYQAGMYYTYDPEGNKIDSVYHAADTVLEQEQLEYYSAPYEIVNRKEIGRSITPYGKGLDLGPEGFTWVYDMTDYAPWLQGEVDLSAHRQNELIDLKFLFIKGTPPRDVLDIQTLWSENDAVNFKYRDLSNDTKMSETEVDLLPAAKQFKVRMRMTGHGHYSNDGSYPHCCEWKDNTHFLYVNGKEEYNWHIFKYNECAENPVFPQGGTWPGAREGWCPGDIIKEEDFELTEFVQGNTISLDYGITPVPENNQGMGNGNYWTTVHFFQYGSPNHQTDVEIYNVLKPNDHEYYSRVNPICYAPEVVVRNNGAETVNTMDFEYYVSGGEKEIYFWEGNLPPNERIKIQLPIPDETFWIGDGSDEFHINVSNPNGKEDEYAVNDYYTTSFDMPDIFEQDIMIHYQTNNRPNDYTLRIKDISGEVVWDMKLVSPSKLYEEPLELPKGCYTLEMIDRNNMGLSYWAYPAQGRGSLSIRNEDGGLLKEFEPDFGRLIHYAFTIGDITYVRNSNNKDKIFVYPNPARDELSLSSGSLSGISHASIIDESGAVIYKDEIMMENGSYYFDTSGLVSGVYIIKIKNKGKIYTKKFIIAR